MNDRLVAAIRYAEREWPVLSCDGKHPLTEHGLNDATTDHRQIEAWWRRWPDACRCRGHGPRCSALGARRGRWRQASPALARP